MKELKEAFIYAIANGITAFSIYTGSAFFFGDASIAGIMSGFAVGLIVFGSYLARENEDIKVNVGDVMPTNRSNMEKMVSFVKRLTPSSIKRYGMFRFF